LGIPFDAVAYQRNDVFQYDFAKDFWFGTPSPDSDLSYYVHQAESPDAAKALFDKLLENHRYDYEVLQGTEHDVLLRHRFLDTFMTLNRRGGLVFGVDNAPEQGELQESLDTLLGALPDEEA